MNENQDNDLLLENMLNEINKDLANYNYYNLEHLLLNISKVLSMDLSIDKNNLSDAIVNETIKYLLVRSDYFKKIYEYDSEKLYLFSKFIKFLLLKYDNMLITEKNIFDFNAFSVSGKNFKKQEIKKLGIDFKNINSIQYTMQLLNEAIRIYYELYDKRTLLALFSDEEQVKFRLEESTLAHVLGIELFKIVQNEKLVDLFKITEQEREAILNDISASAKIDVLLKIVDMSSGNLLTYEEDRLRRVKLDRLKKLLSSSDYQYNINKVQDEVDSPILKYGKVNLRSKAFIDYKPLDEISLSIRFPKGYKLIRQGPDDVDHSILISKNSLSDIFKYSTFITNYESERDRRFFNSLEVKQKDDIDKWKEDGKIAISTQIISDPDPGTAGGKYIRVFSEEEQKKCIQEFLKDFQNEELGNLEELQEYLDYLNSKAKRK